MIKIKYLPFILLILFNTSVGILLIFRYQDPVALYGKLLLSLGNIVALFSLVVHIKSAKK